MSDGRKKRVNWRQRFPEAPQRKQVRAKRVRLKLYSFTQLVAIENRAFKAFAWDFRSQPDTSKGTA